MPTRRKQPKRNGPTVVCSFCGERAARHIKRSHAFGEGARLVVVEGVPMIACDNCGEVYVTGDVSAWIDRVLADADRAAERPVKVIKAA